MRNLYQTIAAILLIVGAMLFSASCSKNIQTYKPDPTNPYANPNPPPMFDGAKPTMSAFAPVSGLPGTVVTISGTNFALSDVVTVNGIKATVNAVTVIDMTVTIPANATTGPIVVTDGTTTLTSTYNFTVTSGTVSTFYDLGSSNIKHITIDKDGNIWGDDGAKTIYTIPKGGALSVYAGGSGSNTFNSIAGVVVNSIFDNIYIADKGTFTIMRVTTAGITTPIAGDGQPGYRDDLGTLSRFALPSNIAIGPDEIGRAHV